MLGKGETFLFPPVGSKKMDTKAVSEKLQEEYHGSYSIYQEAAEFKGRGEIDINVLIQAEEELSNLYNKIESYKIVVSEGMGNGDIDAWQSKR